MSHFQPMPFRDGLHHPRDVAGCLAAVILLGLIQRDDGLLHQLSHGLGIVVATERDTTSDVDTRRHKFEWIGTSTQ